MDLISRKAAIEAVRELLLEPDSTQYIYSSDAIGAVKSVPSVPAVPLEPLAKWIVENLDPRCGCSDCTKERVCCDCPMMTEQQVKKKLGKWMEEQDAAD